MPPAMSTMASGIPADVTDRKYRLCPFVTATMNRCYALQDAQSPG